MKIQFKDRLLKREDSNADALWYPLLKKLGTKDKVFQNYIHRSKHLAISMVFSHYRYPTQVSFYPLRIQRF